MELYLNATSPYARVVRVVALEKGLMERITLRWCDPWSDEPALLAVNPLGRIPALVTDDGVRLSEAPLIAQYLDSLSPLPSLLPPARLPEVLSRAGLGQGLMEAAFNTVITRKHQGAEADQTLLGQRRLRAIARALATLETEPGTHPDADLPTLGDISIAVALAYLSFRMAEIDWQAAHPALALWQQQISQRPSLQATAFA